MYKQRFRKKENMGMILCLMLGIANAETGILLDTSETTSDLVTNEPSGWSKSSNSFWNDVSSHDEKYNTIRVLQVCNTKAPVQKYSWLTTPYIEHNNSTIVFLEVKYRVRPCATIKSPTCNDSFDVLVNMADGPTKMASVNSSAWKQVGRMTGIATQTVEIGPINQKGFFVAFKDFGSCSVILQTRIYYKFCPYTISGLASFPQVGTTNVNQNQMGKCVRNSQPSSSSQAPEMTCTPSGEWNESRELRCICNAGFEPNQSFTECFPCLPGSYKPKAGNQKCLLCPQNSQSTETGADTCPCKSEFYRAELDHHTKPCTETPTAPVSVEFKVNETAVELWWKRPISSGNRNDLSYRIECSQCDNDGGRCGPCSRSVKMPEDLRPEDRNHATVSNLQADTDYNVKIYAVNGVTDVAEEFGQMSKYAEANFRTESSSHYLSDPEIVGSVRVTKSETGQSTVSWAKNSNSDGTYEIRYSDPSDESYEVIITKDSGYLLEGLLPDTEYTVQVRSRSSSGTGPWSIAEMFRTGPTLRDGVEIGPLEAEKKEFNWVIAVILSALLIVGILFSAIFLFIKRNARNWTKGSRSSFYQTTTGPAGTIDATVDLIPCEMRRDYIEARSDNFVEFSTEIDPKNLQIEQVLATFEFGEVFRGIYNGRIVSIKSFQAGTNSSHDFMEAAIMSKFDHVNVLKIEGIVTCQRPKMIVAEYAHNGDLLSFVRNNRPNLDIVSRAMHDVASGMKYLHSKRFIHQNLQAKNIFITLDQTAKIGHFVVNDNATMNSYSGYSTLSNLSTPVKWTAPEVLKTRLPTYASDVWSFGVTMWEAFSLGEQPYWGMSEQEVFKVVEEGCRLPTPANCPSQFHQIMLDCWLAESTKRPTFTQLISHIENLLIEMSQMPKSVAV